MHQVSTKSKKMPSLGAITPIKIFEQVSPYNMHSYTSRSFFEPSFIKNPHHPVGLGGVAKTKYFSKKRQSPGAVSP
jgi:hypothetical protein